MQTAYTIGILALVIIASFAISGISYARQQALKKRKLMVKKLQLQADEALNFQTLLLKIDASYELLVMLQSLAVNALSQAQSILPDDPLLKHNLKVQTTRLNDYKSKKRANKVSCWGTSDSELAQSLSQFGQIDKLFDLLRNRGDLTIAQHQHFQTHLKKLQNEFTTNSYLYQADHFAEQGNLASYQLYMKQAIQSIKKSDISDKEKKAKIQALIERVNQVKATGKLDQLENLVKPPASDAE